MVRLYDSNSIKNGQIQEPYNNLEETLRVDMDGQGVLYTKNGAFIVGQGNYTFDPVLLGPQGNPLQAIAGQVTRRLTGENMPLTKVISRGQSITYYACDEQHVTVINLDVGETIYVESEDLLAFNDACGYSIHFLATGVVSQKGLFTSAITGQQPGAQVAILTSGNPILVPTPCWCDPDAMVAFQGPDPSIKFDFSWKNVLGKTSGETYMLDYKQPGGIVVCQPCERKSGIDLSVDSRNGNTINNTGQGGSLRDTMGNTGDVLNQIGNALGGNGSSGNSGGLGGMGGLLGGLFK